MPPGSDPQDAPSGITEENFSMKGIEDISYTPRLSTGEGEHNLGWSQYMNHSNNVKNTTDINIDAATMDSPSGEEHGVPSQSSHLIPEYTNLLISGLRQIKRIQE